MINTVDGVSESSITWIREGFGVEEEEWLRSWLIKSPFSYIKQSSINTW